MVSIDCFTWTRMLVCALIRVIGIGRRDEGTVVLDLPDDCIIDILSRLPSYDVLRCRKVCKRWRTLTLSAHFIKYQTNRAPTIVYGQLVASYGYHPTIQYLCLDDSKNLKELQCYKKSKFFDMCHPKLFCSFGGLLLFQVLSGRYCLVHNPISGKNRIIGRPVYYYNRQAFRGSICALFFPPSACEFNLLLVRIGEDSISCWYYIFGSSTNNWRKINTVPLLFRPPYRCSPVVFNMSLHWIVNYHDIHITNKKLWPSTHGVMVFNIQSEEISMFMCPVSYCNNRIPNDGFYMMTLFGMDKHLCLSHMLRHHDNSSTMEIWELSDYVNWSWVRRHSIRCRFYPEKPLRYDTTQDYMMKIIWVKKNILLIRWNAINISRLHLWDLDRYHLQAIDDHHISSDRQSYYLFETYTCSLLVPDV